MNSKELSVKFLEGIDKALKELVQKKRIWGNHLSWQMQQAGLTLFLQNNY